MVKRTVPLPPPAQLPDDPALAAYERALGLRSYSSAETQNILGCGETRHDIGRRENGAKPVDNSRGNARRSNGRPLSWYRQVGDINFKNKDRVRHLSGHGKGER
jgi:hypothetical protein